MFERWPGNEVRSWIAISEVSAGQAIDADVEPLSVFASHAVGIGICAATAPNPGPSASAVKGGHAARLLDVRTITGNGATAMTDLGEPVPVGSGPIGPDAVHLYELSAATLSLTPRGSAGPSAPAGSVAASPSVASSPGPFVDPAPDRPWPLGRYAISFAFPFDRPGSIRWLAFELARGGGG